MDEKSINIVLDYYKALNRVIKQNGDYGYYAFGQELKAKLINMERDFK